MAHVNNRAQEVTNVAQDLDIGKYLKIYFHLSERVRDKASRDIQPIARKTLHSASPLALTRYDDNGEIQYLLPMHALGSLAIRFDTEPGSIHAFKIYVKTGSVNVANPESSGHRQDYFVTPGQKWIDGFAHIGSVDRKLPDDVRQFVAIDPGTGHSAENQLTGSDDNGGIQIQIILGTPHHRVGRSSNSGFQIFVKDLNGQLIS
ncbi:hypothetical protein F5B22DRAFT_41252 [Xylaria bambusicola]|uniref:uncharacterized protein n=1 Tax=Xylaria bambusicola TaxID=326684 RepID=UPI002007DFB9|nr:uncharacterized protein F5B22DRAFT_41252 [Xylaria bambusicola]KAI0521176.1 hypothetical protein F5B22DRAFT_41252 [Xylaria bambusicola]